MQHCTLQASALLRSTSGVDSESSGRCGLAWLCKGGQEAEKMETEARRVAWEAMVEVDAEDGTFPCPLGKSRQAPARRTGWDSRALYYIYMPFWPVAAVPHWRQESGSDGCAPAEFDAETHGYEYVVREGSSHVERHQQDSVLFKWKSRDAPRTRGALHRRRIVGRLRVAAHLI